MKPSPSELPILKALWDQGELNTREIHEAIQPELSWSFSSTRKTIERMLVKGFLESRELHGVKVYSPGVSKITTLATMMKDFASRVLEVDGALPAKAFANSKILSDDEIQELEDLLAEENDQ